MNNSNALGFLTVGLTMCLLPAVVPGWFPHVAVDGTSTRALWSEVMGVVQCCLALGFLVRQGVLAAAGWVRDLAPARGAVATADWASGRLPRNVVALDFARRPEHATLTSLPTSAALERNAVFAVAGNVVAFPSAAEGRIGGDFDSPLNTTVAGAGSSVTVLAGERAA